MRPVTSHLRRVVDPDAPGIVSADEVRDLFRERLGAEPDEVEIQALVKQPYVYIYSRILQLFKRQGRPLAETRTNVVPVLMLFRNNESYIETSLPTILDVLQRALELLHMHPRFYFYENNSKDNTRHLLRRVAEERDAMLVTEDLPAVKQGGDRTSTRCKRMALCRNAVMSMALPDIVSAPLVLMLDTNVFFSVNTVLHLAHALTISPRVGMATACTMDARNPEHYYDTYAYMDLKDLQRRNPYISVHRYHCMLRTCNQCAHFQRLYLETINPNQPAVRDVASAFAGIAALRPAAMLSSQWFSQNNLCEHIDFCKHMRQAGYRVCLLPYAHAEWAATFDLVQQNRSVANRLQKLCRQPLNLEHCSLKQQGNMTTVNPVENMTIYEQHLDPFPLRGDACAYPECPGNFQVDGNLTQRQPCLKCFGGESYCCEECMWEDFPDHNFACGQVMRSILKNKVRMAEQRQKQMSEGRGYPDLLKHIIMNTDGATLINSLFFVRLPFDTKEKIKTTHSVKLVKRNECAAKMLRNACLQETYRAWTKHLRKNTTDHIYFFAYPPDFSFVCMTAVPYEEQERFDESLQPTIELVACPCSLHSRQ